MEETRRQMFEDCIEQHAASMYRVAYRLCGDRSSAEELVQETYFQAWRGLPAVRDHARLRSWIFAIMRRQFTKNRRQNLRHRILPPDELAGIPAPETPSTDPREEALRAAIARLDDDHRLPLLLVAMEGISTDEAAEILSVPRGTVLSRLHRAREKIRNAIATIAHESTPTHRSWAGVESAQRGTTVRSPNEENQHDPR